MYSCIQGLFYVRDICWVCELFSVHGASAAFSTRAVQGSGSRGCGHLTTGTLSSSQSAFA